MNPNLTAFLKENEGTRDPLFQVNLLSHSQNPNQVMYAAMHQDYSEEYVWEEYRAGRLPDEDKAGELLVKHLLRGNRGHYGPLEHASFTLTTGYFPHSVMQQARTHRIGITFDCQSFRYTSQRIIDVFTGKRPVEEVFYLRPVGDYVDRMGHKYPYTETQRNEDIGLIKLLVQHYRNRVESAGFAPEHARGMIPFDVRQHFQVSFTLRSLLHFLDMRSKLDAQLEIRHLCDLIVPQVYPVVPQILDWYMDNRYGKARLAP